MAVGRGQVVVVVVTVIYLPVVKSVRSSLSNDDRGPQADMEREKIGRGSTTNYPSDMGATGPRRPTLGRCVMWPSPRRTAGHLGPKFPPPRPHPLSAKSPTPAPSRGLSPAAARFSFRLRARHKNNADGWRVAGVVTEPAAGNVRHTCAHRDNNDRGAV